MAERTTKIELEIRRTPGVCGGRACVGATRIPVWLLVAYLKEGLAEEALLQSYPQLTSLHLRLVRDYYDQHQSEVERDIHEQDEDEAALPYG